MRISQILIILVFSLTFFIFTVESSLSGGAGTIDVVETDATAEDAMVGFFDLRDRETYMQVTNVLSGPRTFHIQIFNVGNNCNENDFFDAYTGNDTHTYNLRDIVTNDGNPSGVVLPNDAYGIFVAYDTGSMSEGDNDDPVFIGNMRILDNSGYEYRTNLVGIEGSPGAEEVVSTFNYNTEGGVTLSDIVGFVSDENGDTSEILMANVLDIWYLVNVDIYDLNEVPFSCRNVIFSCVDEDNPLLEGLLEEVADDSDDAASVASFEYGINEAIPHSRGGELLCPGNVISEGFVRLEYLADGDETDNETTVFVGLNNGNGRGTMDVMWATSSVTGFSDGN